MEKIDMATFKDDVSSYVNSMYRINAYIIKINELINKKEEELRDLNHYAEFLDLTDDEKLRLYSVQEKVLYERRVFKDISSILTVIKNGDIDIKIKSTIKDLDSKINEKYNILSEDRQYNIRNKKSIGYLENIIGGNICKDKIRKGMSKENLIDYLDNELKTEKPILKGEDFEKELAKLRNKKSR